MTLRIIRTFKLLYGTLNGGLFSFILKLSRLSTRLLTSKGIMNINSIDMVWLLIVKLTAILSTKVAKVSN